MKTFTVHSHPDQDPIAIKEGFSWPALVFGVFWLVFKGLWRWLAIYISAIAVLSVASAMTTAPDTLIAANLVANLVVIAMWFVAGTRGNQWYRQKMEAHGFTEMARVSARSKKDALARRLSENAEASANQENSGRFLA